MFDRLAGMPELIDQLCDDILGQLLKLLPELGWEVAVDSTTIGAFANPNRKDTARNPGGPADPDAAWTKKNSARDPSQQEWVFGYKVHVVADANHDIPQGMMVTTASRNDSPLLCPLLEDLERRRVWFSLHNGAVVIADRGYDSRTNNEFVHRNGGIPVIHKRQPASGKLYDGIYTTDGVPTCLGQLEMVYIRTDPAIGHHLYRYPAQGCARRDKVYGVSTCDDEAWEDSEQGIQLFGGRIRRGSPKWQDMYARRWSVERVFSRWNDKGRLDKMAQLSHYSPPGVLLVSTATTSPTALGTSSRHTSPAAPAKWADRPKTIAALSTPCSGYSAPAPLGATCRRTTATAAPPIAATVAWCKRSVWDQLLAVVSDDPVFEWLMIDAGHIKCISTAPGRGAAIRS